MAWVERLFDRLSGFYGSKFADLWRGCDLDGVKRVWADALSGYRADEIRRGLDACLSRVFPPTLPEFLKLCRPLLDDEAAFLEAVEQMRLREHGRDTWSNPAIFWAAREIGEFTLHGSGYQALRGRWCAALGRAIAGVRDGSLPSVVPPRHGALPAPGQTRTPEARAAGLAALERFRRTTGMRSIYLPGEAPPDVKAAFLASGQTRPDFEAVRLHRNGWTSRDERAHVIARGMLAGGMPREAGHDDLVVALERIEAGEQDGSGAAERWGW